MLMMGNQLSSSQYEELVGILVDHKLTFENQLLNIIQKNNQKIHAWQDGLVVKSLDSQSRGPVFKTTGWLQGRLSLSSFQGR